MLSTAIRQRQQLIYHNKAEDFRFNAEDLSDILVDEEGEPLDEDRFESSLGIEEGKDHRALQSMLQDMNDPARTFESVLDQYFDRPNVLAWVATNILVHQADAVRHNFILYNPVDTEKFFFVPWDYDEAMRTGIVPPLELSNDSLRQRSEYGYGLAAGNVLLEGFYRLPGIHEEILQAVDYMRQNFVTDQLMTETVDTYFNLVAPQNIGYGTVSNYLKRARQAGLSWPLPDGMSERDLGSALFPPVSTGRATDFVAPDFPTLQQKLSIKGMTLLLLWEEYREMYPDNGYSYSHFCNRYKDWLGTQRRSMRQVHIAGEKCFVDYAGRTVPIVDAATGELVNAQIFVAVLGASGYTFAHASLSQTEADWIQSHNAAFDFFGGITQIVVPDCLKSAVTKPPPLGGEDQRCLSELGGLLRRGHHSGEGQKTQG